jgi:hypothetical protein
MPEKDYPKETTPYELNLDAKADSILMPDLGSTILFCTDFFWKLFSP